MRTRIENLRARAAGIDAVRGALFGTNDNHIGGAQRVSPRRNLSGSPPGGAGASVALRRAA